MSGDKTMIEFFQSVGYDHGAITSKPCLDNFVLLNNNKTLVYIKNVSNETVTVLNLTIKSIIKTSLDIVTDNPSKESVDEYVPFGNETLENINMSLIPGDYIPILITYVKEKEIQYKSFAKLVVEWI